MKVNESHSSEATRIANLHPDDPEVKEMVLCDSFRNYTGHVDDLFVGRLLDYQTHWLPRIPQASAFIQKWALADNSMLLFTDIEWKFDLEAEFPGATAWIEYCNPLAIAFRQSTPQFGLDGTPIAWCSPREHLNNESWFEWRMLYNLSSSAFTHRLTAERRATLRMMDWAFAKEFIQFILDEGESEMLNVTADEFDFTA